MGSVAEPRPGYGPSPSGSSDDDAVTAAPFRVHSHDIEDAVIQPASPVKGGSSPMAIKMLRSREARLGIFSMLLLVFQGTALSLTLRYSRVQEGPRYLASVAVIYTELVKLLICIGAQLLACQKAARLRGQSFGTEMKGQAREILGKSYPMLVPAGLFVMQQVLVIVAASHLDAVTFQICSQSFKIMPTALLAVWLLGQYLTPMQWASLPVLAVGVVFVTLNGSTPAGQPAAASDQPSELVVGLAASALSGLSSAYAGVYFEKYVKGKLASTLWIRNLQLGIFGLPLSIAYMYCMDGRQIGQGGLMQGFDLMAWSVVALQVFGGLIVGMVVKYADNILKNFANALSVVFTVLGAIPLFHQYPSLWFVVGVSLVMTSVFMYGKSAPQGLSALNACYKSMSTQNLQLLLGSRHRRPGTPGEKPELRVFTCARVALLVTSIVVAVMLVAVTRLHPPARAMVASSLERVNGLLGRQQDQPGGMLTGLVPDSGEGWGRGHLSIRPGATGSGNRSN
ncbi:hypothetical protein WJX72_010196 [[Myrmecia] bisecta]|uniref:UDP-galactose transporter n=1 Tax=[Myrmecia] bisecta TaxID=41462 RepID=A0AAW1PJV8_9CHLO